jgi:hypothetical protein
MPHNVQVAEGEKKRLSQCFCKEKDAQEVLKQCTNNLIPTYCTLYAIWWIKSYLYITHCTDDV